MVAYANKLSQNIPLPSKPDADGVAKVTLVLVTGSALGSQPMQC